MLMLYDVNYGWEIENVCVSLVDVVINVIF